MPYLTPDTLPSDFICRTVLIPNHIDWLIIVNGALSELLKAENFEQFGSITPEETANKFEEMFFEFRDSECAPVTPIGTITMFATEDQPVGWLNCVGTEISRTEYAELFAVIGTNYGVGDGTTTFNVPNLSDLSPMGYGGSVVGSVGAVQGELTVTLNTAQIASHNHSLVDPGHNHAPLGASVFQTSNAGGTTAFEVDIAGQTRVQGATTAPSTTGITMNNTGGGGAHNNLHPVIGMNFIIYAGV